VNKWIDPHVPPDGYSAELTDLPLTVARSDDRGPNHVEATRDEECAAAVRDHFKPGRTGFARMGEQVYPGAHPDQTRDGPRPKRVSAQCRYRRSPSRR